MTETTAIPLNKLALWDGNVRRTGATDGIDELAASISAHGLLQSLVVRKGKRGKFEIVAGQRRFLALSSLLDAGKIANDHPVACMLADSDVDATEISLAENVVRAPMHPADQFEAFRKLIDDGATVTDVAARFGVSDAIVAKRMKLGRLSPVVLEAYRRDEIGLEEAQAFAITDDREAQERVYEELTSWNRTPHAIRRILTADEIASSDKRVRFIGIEAYRAAGGVVRQDLFCEHNTGYLQDVALLDKLVREKLKLVAAEVSNEGWKWVDIAPDTDHQALAQFVQRNPESVPLSDEQQAELEQLSEEYDALIDSDGDQANDRIAEIEQRVDALNALSESWSSETLSLGGAVVSLGYQGDVRIERGLLRKEDARQAAKVDKSQTAETGLDNEIGSGLPSSLVLELTAEKTAALGVELAAKPDIALATVVHALAFDVFYKTNRGESCLRLSQRTPLNSPTVTNAETSKAIRELDRRRVSLCGRLPVNQSDLWAWCLERSRDELLDILALIAAHAIDAIRNKSDRPGLPRLVHGDALARAVGLDMTAWFAPTATSYFNRINRSQIIAAVDEATGSHAPVLEKLKKAELAARAEMLVAGTDWLPEPLRIAAACESASDDGDDNFEL